jgi:CTD nuclear envelope phosphatase 1
MERPTQVPPGITSRVATQSKPLGKSTTAGLASTVTERPIPGPSGTQAEPHVLEINEDEYHSDYDQDEDEDEEDDDFYRDDDEEEEYDLDDALLAREVALAYHQNRAYSQLGQQEARALRGDEDGPYLPNGYDDDEGDGGVMLALPKISMVPDGTTPGASMPSIINPTPDDLRRFVRVGKLDNGKLVLAPGESGWSDEEDEDSSTNAAASSSRARNKEDIRKALLGQGPVREVGERTQPASKADQGLDMPPTVGSSSTNSGEAAPEAPQLARVDPSVASTTTAPSRVPEPVAATPADPPKKVSRFKAARMG